MRNRFVQIWIEFFSLGFDCLQSIFCKEIAELFQNQSHPGIISHVIHDLLYNRLGAVSGAGAGRLDCSLKTEFVPFRIERFRHAVGVKDEAIIAIERHAEISSKPIKHISAVNSKDHARRFYRRNALQLSLVEQWRIVSTAREGDAIALMVKDEICHADKHVFLDVGIKLPVYLTQNIGWGRIPCRLGAQYAAANRHDQGCRNAFTGNVGNCNTKPVFINMNIIEIIATYLARRHIDAADSKSVNGRRFCWKQNSLNVPRNLEVMIESLFFICHRVDDWD